MRRTLPLAGILVALIATSPADGTPSIPQLGRDSTDMHHSSSSPVSLQGGGLIRGEVWHSDDG